MAGDQMAAVVGDGRGERPGDGELDLRGAQVPRRIELDRVQAFQSVFSQIERELNCVMVNREVDVRMALLTLFAGGHVLIVGEPGTGKTVMAKSISEVLGLQRSRVQMQPDLMPSDLAGVYERSSATPGQRVEMEFKPGPIFANTVQIDEINRAGAKVHSGLLEGLEERAVTVDGVTHELPNPHFVIATQNPDGGEGTYRMIDVLRDRFMTVLHFGHATLGEICSVLSDRTGTAVPKATPVFNQETGPEQVREMRELVRAVHVPEEVIKAVAALAILLRRTAAEGERDERSEIFSHEEIAKVYNIADEVANAISTRAAEDLIFMSKARALADGRAMVDFNDLLDVAPFVLTHRIDLTYSARSDDRTAKGVVASALEVLESHYKSTLKTTPS